LSPSVQQEQVQPLAQQLPNQQYKQTEKASNRFSTFYFSSNLSSVA
jgi:hypothetical protein